MFQRILVPLDGSKRAERALPIAARVAHTIGGSIVLVQVVNIPMGYNPAQTQSVAFKQEVLQITSEARKYLADVTSSDVLTGIPTEIEVSYGAPAPTILNMISSQNVDFVIICSHGSTGMKRWALGSVAQKIARHCPVPILILREDGTLPLGSYPDPTRPLRAFGAIVALDGSALSQLTLEPVAHLVAALAAPAKGILHLTHVIALPLPDGGPDAEDSIEPGTQEDALRTVKKCLSNLSEELRQGLAKDLKLVVNWSVVTDADVAQGLIGVAEKGEITAGTAIAGGCDLIAMTTHGRGGIQDWTLGTVAERVLSGTKLPVLIVRPQAKKSLQSLTDREPEEAEV